MAGELHDNAEKQTFAPVGVQSDGASLSQNTQTLFNPLSGIRAASELPQSLDFGSPTDIYGKDNVIAQNYQDVRQGALGTDIVRVAMPPEIDLHGAVYKVEHPYRGHELQEMNKIPANAWEDAYKAFPELESIAKLDQHSAARLMKAITANELDHYGPEDTLEDKAATMGQAWVIHNRTLGFSQQSPDGVRNMAQVLDQDMKAGKRENNPLSQYLHMTDQQLATALEDPKQAPLFVAANLASNARMYERHNYPVSEQTLGYGFNPDMPDRTGKLQHDLLPSPEQLAKSQHAENISKWLKKIGD